MNADVLDRLVCPRSGQPLRLYAFESDATGVVFGVLESEAGCYPIVSGIPIFLDGHERVVELLRKRRTHDAIVLATLALLPRSRLAALAAFAGERVDGPAGRCLSWLGDRQLRVAARELFTPDGAVSPEDVIRFVYLDSPGRSVDAYNYFMYRYSSPRHLVALSCMEALPPCSQPVLDLGCGAGHITWALQNSVAPQPVVGVEKSFFLLLLASHAVAPGQSFICADGGMLPFRSRSFSLVFASDVLSFVTPKWPVVRELRRLLAGGGWLMLTSVKNALCDHVYAGEPLTPDGWRLLVEDLSSRAFPDSLILQRYLDGEGLPSSSDIEEDAVRTSRMLSILATAGPWSLAEASPLQGWPHARGELGVNPLFHVVEGGPAGAAVYERRFPSQTYADDNPEMREYLPERFVLPFGRLPRTGEPAPEELEPLIRSLCLLGFPPGFQSRRWVDASGRSRPDATLSQ